MAKQARAIKNQKGDQLPASRLHKRRVQSDTEPIASEDVRDIQDARKALKETREKGSIPWERVKRELGI
jgi:hypothetical protein